jgi:hypothetical protein
MTGHFLLCPISRRPFTASRSSRKYCSDRCRVHAHRRSEPYSQPELLFVCQVGGRFQVVSVRTGGILKEFDSRHAADAWIEGRLDAARGLSVTASQLEARGEAPAVSGLSPTGPTVLRDVRPNGSEKTQSNQRPCNGKIPGGRSGICGPAHVIEIEVFGGRIWREVVSPDGVRCMVARLRRAS